MANWLWSERFWLPERVKWEEFEPRVVDGLFIYFPQFHELAYSVIFGGILLLIRVVVESFVQLPIGIWSGWVTLERDQSTFGACLHHFTHGLTKKSKFKRVAETGWRFCYYSIIWLVGIYVLYDQPQWSDLDNSWKHYPFHPIENKVWWYYMVQCGFYWSLLFGSFTIDTKRSDFWEMVIHHVVTIALIVLSFTVNFVRVGTLVLICHDTADILLDFGKLARYAGWETTLTVTFILLLITWIGTRLIFFPLYIIRSIIFAAPDAIQKKFDWFDFYQRPIVPKVFVGMLLTLLVLHCFWTVLMLKIAYKSTQKDGNVDDIREDSDSDDEEEKKKEK